MIQFYTLYSYSCFGSNYGFYSVFIGTWVKILDYHPNWSFEPEICGWLDLRQLSGFGAEFLRDGKALKTVGYEVMMGTAWASM